MISASVVIPTYNHADFILRTLQSVFAQTFPYFEVIVVNDGATDRTHDLLMSLADAGKIRYFRQQNAGQAAARNRGIEAARGRYIALLDDDDLWSVDKLATEVETLERNPDVILTYGRVDLIDANDVPYDPSAKRKLPLAVPPDGPSGRVFAEFARRNFILSPGQTLVRRSALDELAEPPFDTDLWGVDDYDLWLRLAHAGQFLFLPRPGLFYRVHSANASKNEGRMHRNEMRLYRKHTRLSHLKPEETAALRQGWQERKRLLSRYWLGKTVRSIKTGKWQDAGRHLATFSDLQR